MFLKTIQDKIQIGKIGDPAIIKVAEDTVLTIWRMTILPAPFILSSSYTYYDENIHDIHYDTKVGPHGRYCTVAAYTSPILFTNKSGKVCTRGRVLFAPQNN